VATEPPAAQWAQPMEVAGLPNLHKVSDGLYRGAEPTPEGVRELAKMGVKTIIDLRLTGAPQDAVQGTGITCVRIPATAWHPETEDVAQFLRIVTDDSRKPIYVHCRRGADRTGMMCAIYRVAVQGWTKDQAIDEMTHGGFGFYSGWQNLVRYVRDLDIEQIEQQAQGATSR
jgi:protein tyrosine/serine phosphatase